MQTAYHKAMTEIAASEGLRERVARAVEAAPRRRLAGYRATMAVSLVMVLVAVVVIRHHGAGQGGHGLQHLPSLNPAIQEPTSAPPSPTPPLSASPTPQGSLNVLEIDNLIRALLGYGLAHPFELMHSLSAEEVAEYLGKDLRTGLLPPQYSFSASVGHYTVYINQHGEVFDDHFCYVYTAPAQRVQIWATRAGCRVVSDWVEDNEMVDGIPIKLVYGINDARYLAEFCHDEVTYTIITEGTTREEFVEMVLFVIANIGGE